MCMMQAVEKKVLESATQQKKILKNQMNSFNCIAAWCLVIIFLPHLMLWWACESRHTKIQKMRTWGYTWRQIGERYKVSPSTAKRWSASPT